MSKKNNINKKKIEYKYKTIANVFSGSSSKLKNDKSVKVNYNLNKPNFYYNYNSVNSLRGWRLEKSDSRAILSRIGKSKSKIYLPEESISKNVYRCPKCFSIPFINVKDNENKVVIDCLNGHHIEMLFSEYMTSEFQKNVSKFECSECGGDKNMKKLMQVCHECNKIVCKDCLASHNKSSPNHHLNSIEKNDIICPLHKSKYSYYCSECKKNLCDECFKNKTDEHQLINFKNINLKNYELSELKSNLDKENEILIKIKKIFNDTLITLSNKFNDIISYKFLCLKYKNNILKTYETKDTNYQIIDNVNHLKFITKDLKIEPEMNELDIIYELFNFLDSIEYNDENNNANNNSEDHSYSNINNSINMNDNNKIMIDTKNKIEESEHEYDNDTEKENNPNEGNKNSEIKASKKEEDENEKNGDEEDKKEETEKEQEERVTKKLKNKSNNKRDRQEETENSKDMHINKNINIVVSSTEDLVNQGTPDKIKENVIDKKKENENGEEEEEEEEEKEEKEEKKNSKKNNKEKDKERNKNENKENNDNNDVSESYLNENEDNIYVYKSTQHIPVASESKESLDKNENLSKTQNIDNESNEPKKRKKKLSKKKKSKQHLNPTTQTETESKAIVKTKKKVIKKGKSKDKLIQNEENKEDEKEKEKNNYGNNNIRIEVNESDSKDINNNNNVEENENENNKKEDGSKGEDITDNYEISKTEENEKDEDNISNDIKIEEVPNTNHEEFKENKIAKKRMKQIKKKKKKKLNITKTEPQEFTQQIEIINTESKKENNIRNSSNSKKGSKKESLRYDNHDDEDGEAQENSDIEEQKIERHIEKHIEVVKDKNFDDDNKSKNSKNSKSSKKKIAITKKINVVNSDQEDEEGDNKNINIKKKMRININTDINEKNNTIDADMNRKLDKFNKIINMDLELDSPMNRSRGSQRSQRIKKRKKIKKKKYLICVDSNGTAKNQKPEEEKEEKQIKITKTTTLIRSRSKERLQKDGSIKNGSPNKVIKNKEINFKIFQDGSNSSFDENSSTKKNEITNIRTKKNIKNMNNVKRNLGANFEAKGSRKMKMIQGKNNAAFLMENKTEVYIQEKDLIKAKNKGLGIFETQIEYDRDALNRSMDGYGSFKNRRIDGYDYNYDEIKYLVERSNSYKKMRNYKKFNEREKINCMKFENGISCLLEINPIIFAIGNLIGDIIVINSHTYKEMKTIREHDGTIISLCLLHDKSILSCSADRKMLKIRVNKDGTQYNIEFVFTGYENYIIKGIELMNSFKIITCSWDDKLFVWEKENPKSYKNTLIFNEGERVVDLLEININYFVSISESNELKLISILATLNRH